MINMFCKCVYLTCLACSARAFKGLTVGFSLSGFGFIVRSHDAVRNFKIHEDSVIGDMMSGIMHCTILSHSLCRLRKDLTAA